ncbi:nuclear mRNA export, poly(A)+RNA binding protein [Apophysomyces sp. BC1034]|nr:nuclear mRNA export, poly(A)+RNA binding protein [Apophysomyces sp. BC1034]
MDNWTRGRGRGRGRGGRGRGSNGGYNDHQDYYYEDNNDDYGYNNDRHQNRGNVPISARLGPTNDNYGYNNSSNRGGGGHNYNSMGGGGGRRGGGPQQHSSPRGGGRGQTFSSNRGRGGRQQYTRDFMDEDIQMNTTAMTSGNASVTVSGYPPGSEEKVIGFMNRKAKTEWAPLDIQYERGAMHIAVASDEVADVLCRMNNYNFGNSTLSIQKTGMGGSPSVAAMRSGGGSGGGRGRQGGSNKLSEFLQERWDPQFGYLNLEELPPTSHSITVVLARLLIEAKSLFGDTVVTVSFARNKLWSVKPTMKLMELFPNIQNVSFEDNEIAEFRQLDALAQKLPHLVEIVLNGNPVQTNSDPQIYQTELRKRFPSITLLDGYPVSAGIAGTTANATPPDISSPQPGVAFGSPGLSSTLLSVKQSFFDQDNSRQAAQDLLSKFFQLYDVNRSALVDLYDPQAILTVAVSRASFAQNTWGQGLPAQRLTYGNDNIIKRLTAFPPTIHDLTRPENFVTDAWQTAGSLSHPIMLFLTVHGEFREATGVEGARYSFDRVFLVAPSQSGSRAQAAGWHYLILSDSIIIRNYSGSTSFQPGT